MSRHSDRGAAVLEHKVIGEIRLPEASVSLDKSRKRDGEWCSVSSDRLVEIALMLILSSNVTSSCPAVVGEAESSASNWYTANFLRVLLPTLQQ